MGVYIAIGLVVALFVSAGVMWYIRGNETYDDLLPPETEESDEEVQGGVENV